ncbi:MAG: LysR family transcriptional regulator [Pseudomonadota bacterium]
MSPTAEELFVQVVQAGSFKKAAEQLEIEPSSVSRKISALEDRLSVRLLHRSTRQTRPTELGQRYYEGLTRLLDDKQALEEEVSNKVGLLSGAFRVSAPVDFGAEFVVPVLRSIQVTAPEMIVEILLGSGFVDLVEQGIDVAVRIGELPDSSLVAVHVGDASRVLVAAPGYLEGRAIPRTPDDLAGHEFVFYTARQARNDIEFADGSRIQHARLSGRLVVNNVRSIERLVTDGAGIHLGPRWAFSAALESGAVRQLLPDFELKSFPVHAVYPARAYLPRKTRVFVESLRNKLVASL